MLDGMLAAALGAVPAQAETKKMCNFEQNKI
jgi:hypothetical protein